MALTLAARSPATTVAQAIQLGIEYDPQPPFDAGSPQQGAGGDRRAAARAQSPHPGAVARGARLTLIHSAPWTGGGHVAGRRGGRPRRFVPGRPLTCDCRWQSTATTRTRSSRAGRRCGRVERTWEVRKRRRPACGRRAGTGRRRAGAGRRPAPTCSRCSPIPSGEPHIGHLKCYSVGDAIAHFRRRLGARVLHPMGYDAFGLPAENHAIKTGVHPRESTAESIASFQRQFRSWGISIDWSRELATRRTVLLPLDAVDLPRAVPRRPRLPQGGRGQVVPERPDGACERAGRRRRALRALRGARRSQAARAVVPAHHRLRRAAARATSTRSSGPST